MRWSLKQLFGAVAFCALTCWCASQVGFGNGLFWFSTAGSAVLSAVFVYAARDEKRRKFAPWVAAPLAVCCVVPVMSLSLFANGAFLFVAGIACSYGRQRTSITLWTVAIIGMSLSMIVGVVPGHFAMRRLETLRAEYPKISLSGRLDYEVERVGQLADGTKAPGDQTGRLAAVNPPVANHSYRGYQLARIHDQQYERFVRANGFGVGRMLSPTLASLERPALRNIVFDEFSVQEGESGWRSWNGYWDAGTSDKIEHLHSVSVADFLDPESFGACLSAGRYRVGFVEHAFHHSPIVGISDQENWIIRRLELVSLLRFDEPRVYVTDHLPRMDQLSENDVPTRALDRFESDALTKIWTERDLIIEEEGERHRMLGALRATQTCLECHQVTAGTLLGAFSYDLESTLTVAAE